MGQIILASASPRRKALFDQIGIEVSVCPAQGEEIITKELPNDVVLELSEQKAREVASMVNEYNLNHKDLVTPQDILVIGADTVVSVDGEILGKPVDEDDAFHMLSKLEGKTHEVYTGVAFIFIDKSGKAGKYTFYEKTEVTMAHMSIEDITRYIATGEPLDKAGAYGIQGRCAVYISKINGDYNNVVGLPVARIYNELLKLGINPYLW